LKFWALAVISCHIHEMYLRKPTEKVSAKLRTLSEHGGWGGGGVSDWTVMCLNHGDVQAQSGVRIQLRRPEFHRGA
jgi:hypothetical protein